MYDRYTKDKKKGGKSEPARTTQKSKKKETLENNKHTQTGSEQACLYFPLSFY